METKINKTEYAVQNKFDEYIKNHDRKHDILINDIKSISNNQEYIDRRLNSFESPHYNTFVDDNSYNTNLRSVIIIGRLRIEHDKRFNRFQKWLISKLFNAVVYNVGDDISKLFN